MSDNLEQQSHEREPEETIGRDEEPVVEEPPAEADGPVTEAEQGASEVSQEEPREATDWRSECERLKGELEAALAEQDRLLGMYRRLRADFDNFRRRKNEEMDRLAKSAAADLILQLLPVVDNMERALVSAQESEGPLASGVQLILRQFLEVLQQHGVEPIASVGQPFDPNLHEAVDYVQGADSAAPGTVIDEVRKGYILGDQVLRPSMVRVAGD